MSTLSELQAELLDAKALVITLTEKIRVKQSKTLVKCADARYREGCGMALELGELTYIQTYQYVGPYGCSGGDYWEEKGGEFDCPHCGHRNRLYDRPEIMELKYCFKDIVEEP